MVTSSNAISGREEVCQFQLSDKFGAGMVLTVKLPAAATAATAVTSEPAQRQAMEIEDDRQRFLTVTRVSTHMHSKKVWCYRTVPQIWRLGQPPPTKGVSKLQRVHMRCLPSDTLLLPQGTLVVAGNHLGGPDDTVEVRIDGERVSITNSDHDGPLQVAVPEGQGGAHLSIAVNGEETSRTFNYAGTH